MQALPARVYRDSGLTSLPLSHPYLMYNKGGYIDPDAERYGFGGFLKGIAPVLAGFAMAPLTGGMSLAPGMATAMQIGAGALTGFGLGGFDNIMDAVTGGLGGYAGGSMFGGIAGIGGLAEPASATSKILPSVTKAGVTPLAGSVPFGGASGFGGTGAGTAAAQFGGQTARAVTGVVGTEGTLGGVGNVAPYGINPAQSAMGTYATSAPGITSSIPAAASQGELFTRGLGELAGMDLNEAQMEILKEGAKKGIPLAAAREALTPVDQPDYITPMGTYEPETPKTEAERQALQMKGLLGGPYGTGEGPMAGWTPPNTAINMPTSVFPRYEAKGGGSIPFQTGDEVPAPTYENFYVDPNETKRRLLEQSESAGLSNVMMNKLNMMANPEINAYAKNLEEDEKALLGELISKQEEANTQSEETPLEEEYSVMQSPEEEELQSVYKGTFTPEGRIPAGGTFGITGQESAKVSPNLPAFGTFGGGRGTTFSRHEGGHIPFHTHDEVPLEEKNWWEDIYGSETNPKELTPEQEEELYKRIIEEETLIEMLKDKEMEERGLMFNPNIPWTPEMQSYAPYREMAEGGLTPSKGGGQPALEGGSFVLPADVVSGIGDGSSEEGHDILAKWFEMDEGETSYAYGGQSMLGSPLQGQIKGPGGGLDDLIQTSIDGVRSARVSNDEFVVPSAVVNQLGGPEKLYGLMKNVRKSRNGTTKQAPSIKHKGLNNLMMA